MKKLIIAILALAMLACTACSKGATPDPTQPSRTESSATEPSETEPSPAETFVIQTKFCDVRFPAKWEGKLRIEENGKGLYAIAEVKNALVPLFELTFDSEIGEVVGILSTDTDHTVYLNKFEISDSHLEQEDYDDCLAMQEDVSVLLEGLEEDYVFTPKQTGRTRSRAPKPRR